MGAFLSLFKGANLTQSRILILGLDNSGKTSLLIKMGLKSSKSQTDLDDDLTVTPTIGYNVKEFSYKGVVFNCWDLGGQKNIRSLWKHYYKGSNGIIYIVDSADHNRLKESKQELFHLLEDPDLKNVPVLIFANKRDKEGAISATELIAKFELEDSLQFVNGKHDWYVESVSTVTGEGIESGLKWLVSKLKQKPSKDN
ncbi:ARF/SAR family small GTPase [Naegleria gruberi]|uniref:ARF/SAR family small GTPase n=1 Tax=Naegleria gruberi TaxID=5762 RepID=D2UY37_NAEGR|nr:ARF/SAR family small GTPase [Naegleria gruberi]EFC50406.1 ARF/SAR family small GTPase [Naegleria gruberi]|eukprot:XP_002683150.1 ARF/SAR family small GTPase [Naegleria gruberi strain NEG-M]